VSIRYFSLINDLGGFSARQASDAGLADVGLMPESRGSGMSQEGLDYYTEARNSSMMASLDYIFIAY
jgi:hypothetical protein